MKRGWKVFIEHYKSREHWYVKYLVWFVVGAICFAILVQILKEVGFTPAQKIFDFFNQWALVLSAGATLLLAGAAFWAIMDNRHTRRLDRKERQLNDIIEWASDILKCPFEVDIAITAGESRETVERLYRANILLKYRTVNTRTAYIEAIVSSPVFNGALVSDLKSVIKTLGWVLYIRETYIQYEKIKEELIKEEPLIEQEIRAKMKEKAPKVQEALQNCETLLHTSALALLKEATKIKTSDIS